MEEEEKKEEENKKWGEGSKGKYKRSIETTALFLLLTDCAFSVGTVWLLRDQKSVLIGRKTYSLHI